MLVEELNEWVSFYYEDFYKDGWNLLVLLSGKLYRGVFIIMLCRSYRKILCFVKLCIKYIKIYGKDRDRVDLFMKVCRLDIYKYNSNAILNFEISSGFF